MTTKIDGPTCSGAAGGVPLDIAVPASCRSHIIAYNDVDSADTAQMTTAVGVRLWIYGDNIRRHSTPILFIFSRIRCVRAYACICVCACMHERICFCIGMSWHTPVVCRECSQYSFRVHIVCWQVRFKNAPSIPPSLYPLFLYLFYLQRESNRTFAMPHVCDAAR